MVILGAATLAYDDNEIHLDIRTEQNEVISLGDIVEIPMNDHSTEQRKVVGIFKDWRKWRDGKSLQSVYNGESATLVINDIHSGKIHSESSPYDDEDLADDCVTALSEQGSIVSLDYVRWSDKPEKYKHRLIINFLKQEISVRNSITGTENVNRYSLEYDKDFFDKFIRDTGIFEFDITARFVGTGKTRNGFVCKCKVKFHDGKSYEIELNQIDTDNPLERVLIWLNDYDDRLDMTWFI